MPQGIGADLIATIEGWSREDVDTFAAESNHRAAKAWANGYFSDSVIPVRDLNGLVVLDHDELIRPDTSVEGLAGLKPSFAQMGRDAGFDDVALEKYHWIEKIDHVHHAGNSSGIVDGAAIMAIGTEEVGTELGLTPRARIVSMAVSGADPTIMLTGPAPAARKALAKAGLEVDDIDLFEINEAFAAVAMRFMRDMGITDEITNVNGGAIAMGHPLGATGAMILGTLIDELDPPRPEARPRHALRRRRHGHRHHRRDRLTRRCRSQPRAARDRVETSAAARPSDPAARTTADPAGHDRMSTSTTEPRPPSATTRTPTASSPSPSTTRTSRPTR